MLTMGAFHLRRLAGNVAGKLGNAYLRYQNRQPATCFPLAATVAMLAIPVLPVKWKAPLDLLTWRGSDVTIHRCNSFEELKTLL